MNRWIFLALLPCAVNLWADEAPLLVQETEGAIVITNGKTPVLTYHKAEVPPPAGVDPVFRRSGFIHPLCTPKGEPVTGIHPADHYHHLGLWHAWVKTKHGKDAPDFWNLKGRTGRVRYARTIAVQTPDPQVLEKLDLKELEELLDKPVGFVVEQEHVAYKGKEKKETVVLRERFDVSVTSADPGNLVEYLVEQKNVSDQPLELPAYRYGGCLAYRAPHHWDQTNSDYLTSEGLDRTNSHQSRAEWVRMHGPTGEGTGSLTVFIHPSNHDFPQRLRTWPANSHNGAIFFNVVPTQEKAWEIKPGETIRMRYLLVAADGIPETEDLDEWWAEWSGDAE